MTVRTAAAIGVMRSAAYNRGSSLAVDLGPIPDRPGAHSFVLCHQITSFDWKAQGARPHPIGSLSNDRLEQVLEIVGQILGFVVQRARGSARFPVRKSLQSGLLSDGSGAPQRIPRRHHHTTDPDTPRPKRVVVIQADALTEAGLATLLVRVPIRARDRLLLECWGMAEQPRTLDRNRMGEDP